MATAAPAKPNGTNIATAPTQKRQLTIRDRLNSPDQIAEIARAMPKHCSADRMARIAISALNRTPKLELCTQLSFFKCLMDLSQWGLEPDGRRAHLIPYKNNKASDASRKKGGPDVYECSLIIDYKGLVELAYRSGVTKNINADIVHEGDIFAYSKGKIIDHVPHFLRRDADKPADRGAIYAVYCEIELAGGTTKTEVLSTDEVEAVRKRSKAGKDGPWVTDWAEMAKKTAFRRASKWVPLSAEVIDAMEGDDDTIDVESTPQRALAGTAPRSITDLTEALKAGNHQGDEQEDPNGEQGDSHDENAEQGQEESEQVEDGSQVEDAASDDDTQESNGPTEDERSQEEALKPSFDTKSFEKAVKGASSGDLKFLRNHYTDMSRTDAEREYVKQACDAQQAVIDAKRQAKSAQKELPGS